MNNSALNPLCCFQLIQVLDKQEFPSLECVTLVLVCFSLDLGVIVKLILFDLCVSPDVS